MVSWKLILFAGVCISVGILIGLGITPLFASSGIAKTSAETVTVSPEGSVIYQWVQLANCDFVRVKVHDARVGTSTTVVLKKK